MREIIMRRKQGEKEGRADFKRITGYDIRSFMPNVLLGFDPIAFDDQVIHSRDNESPVEGIMRLYGKQDGARLVEIIESLF